jgi:hypothetical protein
LHFNLQVERLGAAQTSSEVCRQASDRESMACHAVAQLHTTARQQDKRMKQHQELATLPVSVM